MERDHNFDLRAEFLAAHLTKEEQIIISPDEGYIQGVEKEVTEVSRSDDSKTIIKVRRSGMYGHLPEALFVELPAEGLGSDKAKVVAQQILDVKRFFRPFDEAMYFPRIFLEQQEQNVPEKVYRSLSQASIRQRERELLDDHQLAALRALAPYRQQFSGDLKKMSAVLSFLLELPVVLILKASNSQFPTEAEKNLAGLGYQRLGVDTVLIGAFKDGIKKIEVRVGPLNEQKIVDFLPEDEYCSSYPKAFRTLDFFCDQLLPFEHPYEIVPVLAPAENENTWESRLGYTYIA